MAPGFLAWAPAPGAAIGTETTTRGAGNGADTSPNAPSGPGAGADLTAARHAHRDDPHTGLGADEAGRSVTPHLRRPHWHSYWTGPRTHPENRQLVLRYIAPVLVGVKDLDLPVTVRTAQPPR